MYLLHHPEVETGSNDEELDMDQTVIERVLTTAEVHAPAARAKQREDPQITKSSHPQLKESEKSPITYVDASTQTQPPEDPNYCVTWCTYSG